MPRQGSLADLFSMFPGQLKMQPRGFHSYSFIKRSRIETLRNFLVNFMKWLPWKWQLLQNFKRKFSICICMFYDCAKFCCNHVAGKKLSQIKIFKFLVSVHLNSKRLREFRNPPVRNANCSTRICCILP